MSGRGLQKVISITSIANQLKADNPKRWSGFQPLSDPDFGREMRVFALQDLFVDRSYQRPPKPELIDSIVKNFQADAVVTLVVAERLWCPEDAVDRYTVVEGQQRGIALCLRGYTHVLAIVIPATSLGDEMDLFRLINNKRRAVSADILHKQEVYRRIPTAVALDRVVHATGFTIAPAGKHGTARGVKKMHELARVYARSGAVTISDELRPQPHDYYVLEKGLTDYKALLGSETTVDTPTLAGLVHFQDAYRAFKGKELAQKDLVEAFRKQGIAGIRVLKSAAKTVGAVATKGAATNQAYAALIADIFSQGTPARKKLPKDFIKKYGR